MDPDPHQNVMDPERSFIVMWSFQSFLQTFFISTVLSLLVKKMSFRFHERIFHRMDRWLLGVGACLLLASSLVAQQQQQQQDEEGSGNGTERSTATSGAVSDYPDCMNQFFLISDQLFESIGTQFRYTVREGEFDYRVF